MIKFQKSQALTSHFESFWSIVHLLFSITAHSPQDDKVHLEVDKHKMEHVLPY